MGSDDPVSVDEEVEDSIAVDAARLQRFAIARNSFKPDLIVVLIAAAIFLGCAFSPLILWMMLMPCRRGSPATCFSPGIGLLLARRTPRSTVFFSVSRRK